jgi:pimeloyl-ACP methyl ester carboxylesterase
VPLINTRGGSPLYVKDWGKGRPVVLIHGWPLSSDTWDAIAYRLVEAGYRTISYDRRGFGRSDSTWDGYDYESLTDDLHDIIEALGLKEATLVGFSMGGGEVISYAQRHPESIIDRLILISTVLPLLANPNGPTSDVFREMKKGILEDRAAFFEEFFRDFFNIRMLGSPVSNAVLAWYQSLAMQASLPATLACIDSFAFTNFEPQLKTNQLPVLLIHGDSDRIVPLDSTSAQSVSMLENARLFSVAGGSHGILETHREMVIREMLEFLRV